MTDLLDEAAVEDRLRRAFAVRALDVPAEPAAADAAEADTASGDGARGFPVAVAGRAHRLAGDAADPGRRPEARPARPRTRRLGIAAAALAVAGVGAALATGDGADRARVTAGEADLTTVGPPSPDAGAGADDYRATDAEPFTQDYVIAMYVRDQSVLYVEFEAGLAGPPSPEGFEPATAGRHQASLLTGPDGTVTELYVPVDAGSVALRGEGLAREVALDAAAQVSYDRVTGGYTLPPPRGWDAVWTSGPGDDQDRLVPTELTLPQRDALRWSEPGWGPSKVLFARREGAAAYEARWFPQAPSSGLAPGAEPVRVGDRDGLLDRYTPEGSDVEAITLWVLDGGGVVHVQALGMTADEVVDAATRIEPTPGGENIRAHALAGFEPVPDGLVWMPAS